AWVLRVGTVVYLAAAALSFRVPARVDVPRPQADPQAPGQAAPGTQGGEGWSPGPGSGTRPPDGEPSPGRPPTGQPHAAYPGHQPAGRRPAPAGSDGDGAGTSQSPTRWRTLRQLRPVVRA